MHSKNIKTWKHSHIFGQNKKRSGENRTLIVILITTLMMVVEISTGILFGSMALLADGLHMASHAGALAISYFAYIYARRHAEDKRFSFGTGKVNPLAGYTGAILLVIFAVVMIWESFKRIMLPVDIAFNQAIFVAMIGLVINAICFFVLQNHHHESDDHHHDHNLKSACLHVLADALTSLLAIFALLCGKYYGLRWMDPLMGIVGAILILRWSWGLLKSTITALLDHQADSSLKKQIIDAIEIDSDSRVTDFHLWSIGPNIYSLILTVVAHNPKSVQAYKDLLPGTIPLVHITIEVHQCLSTGQEQMAASC